MTAWTGLQGNKGEKKIKKKSCAVNRYLRRVSSGREIILFCSEIREGNKGEMRLLIQGARNGNIVAPDSGFREMSSDDQLEKYWMYY